MPGSILGHVVEDSQCKVTIGHAIGVCPAQSVVKSLHVIEPARNVHAGLASVCDDVAFKGGGAEGIPGLID